MVVHLCHTSSALAAHASSGPAPPPLPGSSAAPAPHVATHRPLAGASRPPSPPSTRSHASRNTLCHHARAHGLAGVADGEPEADLRKEGDRRHTGRTRFMWGLLTMGSGCPTRSCCQCESASGAASAPSHSCDFAGPRRPVVGRSPPAPRVRTGRWLRGSCRRA